MVRVLAVSDVPDQGLLASLSAVATADLILACGDLPFDYLSYLMNALDVPLVFVPGNHDPDLSGYRTSRAGLTLRSGLPARPPWPTGAASTAPGPCSIDPGSPWRNAWIESFNGRLRNEFLNGQRSILLEAPVLIEGWRIDDNMNCPHSAHGWLSPNEFARAWTTRQQPRLT